MTDTDLNNPKKICFRDEEEREALEKFKKAVADLNQVDDFLIRFLRARERNLENAEKMLRNCLIWKKENDIPSYVNYIPPKYFKEDYNISFKFTGLDNEARPVVWIPLGGVLAKECIEAGHKENIFQLSYNLLETGMHLVTKSEQAHQVVAVLGLENMSMKKIMHLETMQTVYKIFQNLEQNYPEILRSLIVVNAPWYFNIVYNFIKPILSAHTISKLHVFDSNKEKWMGFINGIMPPESIHEDYLDD